MFIKEAVVTMGRRLLGGDKVEELHKNLLVHLVFLTTFSTQVKNYLSKCVTEEKLFIVPDIVRSKASRKRLILVLDMDETLVHTRSEHKPTHGNYISTNFEGTDMYIEPRPYAKQFLRAVAEIFTVYIYTAGRKKYADAVLDQIDTQGHIQKRFYRESCKKVNGSVLKDLRYLKKLAKTKAEMVLVDDNSESINNNYPLALKIAAFEGDQTDKALLNTFESILKFYK